MTTARLGLDLPVVGDPGPGWATKVVNAYEALDAFSTWKIPAGGTEAEIGAALAAAHSAGGGVVELLGDSYTAAGAPAFTITLPTVSLRAQGSGATVIHYTGTGACFLWQPSPFTVLQEGSLKGITIDGTGNANANAKGLHFKDTGTLPALDDVVISNFTGTSARGIYMENPAQWNERANGNRVHLDNNTVGMEMYAANPAAPSFGYHRWIDLRLNVNANQVGIRSSGSALVYSGLWQIICNIGGNNATVIDVAGSSFWFVGMYQISGEITGSFTGCLGIKVANGAALGGYGTINLGCPNSNLNILTAGGTRASTLRVIPSPPVVADIGTVAAFSGADSATMIPSIIDNINNPYATLGVLVGNNINSLYASIYQATGNAFVWYSIPLGSTIGQGLEIARIGQDGKASFRYSVNGGAFATGARPSASYVGAGGMIYDTTLSKPIWSNGTVWKDATGTTV